MDDLSSMSLSKFRLWSEHALKVYLSCRNRSVNGDFDELAARAFCVWEENLPVNESAELAEKRLLAEYKQKLIVDGDVIPDPFSLSTSWQSEKVGLYQWPSVYITDVSTYFGCSTTNEVMNKLMNEYKLGKAYRYFDSEWVKEVYIHKIRDNSDKVIMKTKVTPSQAVNSKCYDVWAIITKDTSERPGGRILSAYCSCTAGMLGSCNHVAGLLFRVEKAVKLGETKKSSTSRPSEWNVPKGKVSVSHPVKARDVVWSKGRYDRTKKSKIEQLKIKQLKTNYTPMTKQQNEESKNETKMRHDLHSLLNDDIQNSSLSLMIEKRRIKPPPKPDLPPSVVDVTKEMSPDASIENVCEKLRMSSEQRDTLKNATVQQSMSETWAEQRKGRITASIFQRVSSRVNSLRKADADPSALVETIVKRKQVKQTVAMKHGLALEPCAKKEYSAMMKKKHKQFQSFDSGLTVDLNNPFLAASADLEVECACCGKGLCEVKCPESIKDQSPSLENVPYLRLENSLVCLDEKHAYYFQVQGQMKISERQYCDLYVFTLHGYLCTRVIFNKTFWEGLEKQLVWFWGMYVLPALLNTEENKENERVDSNSDKFLCITPEKKETQKKNISQNVNVCRGLLPALNRNSVAQPMRRREKRKKTQKPPVYLCGTCGLDCVDDPQTDIDQSVNCDKCGVWVHFVCAGVSGHQLKEEDTWFCTKCANVE